MAAATSATVTVDPPAVKKRGRPRKVVDESAIAPEKSAVRQASTKAKAAPKATAKTKTMDALKEKKKTLTRVSDYKTRKETSVPKAAPAEIAQQATPVTPTSSKILDEVKAAGAFDKAPTEPQQQEPFLPPVPGPAPAAPILPAAATTSDGGAKPAPAQVPETHYEPPSSSPASGTPIQQPVDKASPKPIIPPTTAAPSERQQPRATTIPLPRNPLTAPSPTSQPPKPRIAFAEPAPRAPPRAPRYPTRIIEPTPNAKLPPKYKKAARQVTTIIVGIPIILVVGYELYGRWRRQIDTKFEERERRRTGPHPLSVVGEK